MWKARSILERCLLIISAVLLLTIVVLAIVISSKNGWDEAQILHVTSQNLGEGKKNDHDYFITIKLAVAR